MGEFLAWVLQSLEVTTNSAKFYHYQCSLCLLKVPELDIFLYKFALIDKSCAVGKKLDISQLQTFPYTNAPLFFFQIALHTSISPIFCSIQGDHLSGKPGNVREFVSCQGNIRDFTENQGIVREKILSGKSCLKLFIVKCTFVSIQVFSGSLLCLKC